MSEYNQFSLSQAAQYDHRMGLKNKITAWGLICRIRAEKKTARKHKPGYTKLKPKKVNTW